MPDFPVQRSHCIDDSMNTIPPAHVLSDACICIYAMVTDKDQVCQPTCKKWSPCLCRPLGPKQWGTTIMNYIRTVHSPFHTKEIISKTVGTTIHKHCRSRGRSQLSARGYVPQQLLGQLDLRMARKHPRSYTWSLPKHSPQEGHRGLDEGWKLAPPPPTQRLPYTEEGPEPGWGSTDKHHGGTGACIPHWRFLWPPNSPQHPLNALVLSIT